jgi:hypothetical protein
MKCELVSPIIEPGLTFEGVTKSEIQKCATGTGRGPSARKPDESQLHESFRRRLRKLPGNGRRLTLAE